MDEMMNYIFSDLSQAKYALRVVGKTLKRQRATNRRLGILVVVATVYAVTADICHREKIKELEAEIEELRQKGD